MKWAVAALLAVATASSPAQDGESEDKRMHVETTFEVLVQAGYAEAAELFSPEGERAWAGKHWDPKFVYPVPARDMQGAVFTVSHGPINAVWVVAQHDLEARHFQYVYFMAGLMVTKIDVALQPIDAKTTRVIVTYARTAISEEGDAHVKAMSEGDGTAGKEWQAAIDEYLQSRVPAHTH